MKYFLPKILLVALVVFAFSINLAFAASLALNKIGALDVGGKKISGQWYYTSNNPTLVGTAAANSTVNINIDGTDGSAAADGSGNWQFYSDKLIAGNHPVIITSSGETISFSLNIGQNVPQGTASATPATGGNPIPVTGTSSIITYVGISSALVLGGSILLKKRNKINS